jgi:predicted RNase H-like nuclease (RuvC/YqgF family)
MSRGGSVDIIDGKFIKIHARQELVRAAVAGKVLQGPARVYDADFVESQIDARDNEIESLRTQLQQSEERVAELVGLLRDLREEYCKRIQQQREPGPALCKAADALHARYQSVATHGGDDE